MNEVTTAQNTAAKTDEKQDEKQNEKRERALIPPVDVIEDSMGITLYADLPGVPREALNIRVEADTLLIEGEFGLEVPAGMEASHAEVSRPRYHRLFTLSKELDSDKVSAELKNGVLKLRIPKAEHAQPRRIQINVT